MSLLPRPPARVEAKTSVRPLYARVGWISFAAVLSGAPTFSGGDHGSWTLRRVDLQRSDAPRLPARRSEEHTSELQSQFQLVCRLLLEKKKTNHLNIIYNTKKTKKNIIQK